MDSKMLTKYLYALTDLEKRKYTVEKLIRNLENEIRNCQSKIQANINLNANEQAQSERLYYNPTDIVVTNNKKGITLAASVILGWILFINLLIAFTEMTGSGVVGLFAGAAGFIAGATIPWIIRGRIMKKKYEEACRNVAMYREQDTNMYYWRIEENNKLSVAIPNYQNDVSALKNLHKTIRDTLTKLYSVGIIPEDYRKLEPICTFYGYFKNGRTYSIVRNGFDEGAINMYERELRDGIIISELRQIKSGINQLIANQGELYGAVLEADRENRRMLTSINNNITEFRTETKNSLEVLKYQSQIRTECAKYAEWRLMHG